MNRFDNCIKRKGTNCVKWDGPSITEDIIPMWIADMDFQTAPAITKNLQEIAGQGVFGYQFLSEKYYEAVINWMWRRHQYRLSREEICYMPNVVMGLSFAVQTVSEPGDEVLVMTPVYGPFFNVVKDNGRILTESPMKNENGYYTMDVEDLESKITPKTKAIMLCNPHNPSGRVWSQEELNNLADICIRHNLYIISDDIHCELVSEGYEHTFISLLSEEIRDRCIICTSPSKAFNLASIHVANCFISNRELRNRFLHLAEKSHAAESNAFAEAVLLGAYDESEEWLQELNTYIKGNIDCFTEYICEHIPQLNVCKPESTYLVWVDCRKLCTSEKKPRELLLEKCGIMVNDGEFFGKAGKGFVRFNLACPRTRVKDALKRLEAGIGMMDLFS